MSQGQPPLNPYAPPREVEQLYAPVYKAENLEHLTLLVQFRQWTRAIAGFWIFIGIVASFLCLDLLFTNGRLLGIRGENVVLTAFIGGAGVVWFSVGIAAGLKYQWAVCVGLGLSYLSIVGNLVYLSLPGNLVRLNVCGIIILPVVILQAHRVLGFAKRLRVLGIPLTTRPEQLTMQVAAPPGPWPT